MSVTKALVAEVGQHVVEAIEANQNGKHETRGFEIQLAKVKVQLALVEQQKIANLLTVLAAGGSFLNEQEVSKAPAQVTKDRMAARNVLRAEVREGLDLS